MKVYVLYTSDMDGYDYTKGVFSSYSAMLTWLKEKFEYVSKPCKQEVTGGCFIDILDTQEGVYVVGYNVFDVIGEHSHKTNTIKFD